METVKERSAGHGQRVMDRSARATTANLTRYVACAALVLGVVGVGVPGGVI
jgi:hypothetical protein